MNKLILVPLTLLLFSISAAAQKKIDSALNRLTSQPPGEKVYIHYDKTYYVAGETAWFKAYLYNNNAPSDLSYNFYLQLLDSKGEIIITQKYPVKGATVSGSINIPDSLPQGNYIVRAATPAMLNSNPDFLYLKNLFVFNPSAKESSRPVPVLPLSVRFFPEGGNMVDDLLAVVAFKATDASGKPVEINGIIRSDDTVVIASFKSYHDGIGKFQFKPKAGKKYVAAIAFQGQTVFYPLPEAQSSGINLKIENEKGGKLFVISRSRKEKELYSQLRVVAQQNNKIVFDNEVAFDDFYSVKGHLLTDSMPSGILHFTIFNSDGMPLAERLTFVDNKEYRSNGSVELIKQGTGARQENIFAINFPDPVQRSLSVSVTDLSISGARQKDDIISSLLLTSDLRGNINNPGWYFLTQNDSAQQGMDNLMLTHGWRRFSWKKIMDNELPVPTYKDNYLITLSGSLKDSKTGQPVSGGMLSVFLESEDSVNQSFEVPVGSEGQFVVDSLLFWGQSKLFYGYKTVQGREKTVDITLDRAKEDAAVTNLGMVPGEGGYIPSETDMAISGEAVSNRYRSGNSILSKTKDLAPVVIESNSNKRPIEQVNEKYTKGVFTQMGRVNFDNINQPENNRSLSVYDFVRRSVKQLAEQGGNFVNTKNFSLFKASSEEWYEQKQKTLDSTMDAAGGAAPGSVRFIDLGIREKGEYFPIAVFLNESLTDISFLKTIRMDEVALIKFYEPGFIGAGTGGPGGALSIYTKELHSNNNERIEKLDEIRYEGYSITKEFYSPDYSISDPLHTAADTRTTLLWNPDVYTTGDQNTVRLRFFNNDVSNKFKVIIEGFDSYGKLIHIERVIEN